MEDRDGQSVATRKPLAPQDIHLPPGMQFDCHHSGRCCEDFWEIPVDRESLERLRSLPLSSMSPKFLAPDHYTEPRAGRPGELALHRIDGRCVFLTSGRRCVIHANFGGAAKPQTCQDFPYRYVCTPGGVYLGLSLACPSVRANEGRPVEARRAELAAGFARSLSVRTVADPIELAPGLPIGFEAYEQIESVLKELLSFETMSLDDRLIGGHVFLQLLERAVRELDEPPERAGANIIELIGLFRKSQYQRVAAIARKARGSRQLHRALLGLLTTYRSAFDQKQRGRLGQTTRLLYQYFRHMSGFGRLSLPPISQDVSKSRMRTARVDWTDPYFVHQIQRFCQHAFFRKDLIVDTPVNKGYGFLLLFVALIHWYAAAYCVSRSDEQVERNDLDEAIGAVEKYYCFHTDFMRLFDRFPLLCGTVDRLFAKPMFAPSMLRHKGP